jgi:hypothetical protein
MYSFARDERNGLPPGSHKLKGSATHLFHKGKIIPLAPLKYELKPKKEAPKPKTRKGLTPFK